MLIRAAKRATLIPGLQHFDNWTLVISLRNETGTGKESKQGVYNIWFTREKETEGQGQPVPCLPYSGLLDPFKNRPMNLDSQLNKK